MNQQDFNITKEKNKHLSNIQIENIIREYDSFVAAAKERYKKKDPKDKRKTTYNKRNIGKTKFMKQLAKEHNCSVSTIYYLINQSTVVLDDGLKKKTIHSTSGVIEKRSRVNKNHSKLYKARHFIEKVIKEVKKSKFNSIDETIHDFILNRPNEIKGLETICTKTLYNYVHKRLVNLTSFDLPRVIRRKHTKSFKTYTKKGQRGDSIDLRPLNVLNREEFGHWEGDLVTGPRDGQNGAFLTLVERKTRFYYMIPIKNKKSKSVYMAINKLNKLFADNFSSIFKTITFDNGAEFARYKDMEKKPGTNVQRTKVYFAHPYASYERGSNEISNQLIRYYINKGTDINTPDKSFIKMIQLGINNKKRKILGYKSAESLFKNELLNLNIFGFNKLYVNF